MCDVCVRVTLSAHLRQRHNVTHVLCEQTGHLLGTRLLRLLHLLSVGYVSVTCQLRVGYVSAGSTVVLSCSCLAPGSVGWLYKRNKAD